jgi:hypothetical protein
MRRIVDDGAIRKMTADPVGIGRGMDLAGRLGKRAPWSGTDTAPYEFPKIGDRSRDQEEYAAHVRHRPLPNHRHPS